MADTSGLPPEGWYPDRPNATRLRHWTGTGWTSEFRPIAPAPEPEPVPEPERMPEPPVRETTDQALSRRELRARVGALVQDAPHTPAAGVTAPTAAESAAPGVVAVPEPVVLTAAAVPASPAEPARAVRQPWQDSFSPATTGSSQTVAGWLYAASPLWLAGLMIAGTTVLSIVNPLLVQGGLALVGFAVTFLLARQDVRQLRDRGYRPPSVWWFLLPLLYFVVRMVRVGVRGLGMAVTYLLSSVALVAVLSLAFLGNPALLSLLTPSVPAESSAIPTPVVTLSAQERESLLTEAGTEAQLRLELAKTFEVGDVDCVPFASDEPGTTTTCVVVLDGVSYNAGLEATPDEPGTAFLLTGMLPVQN